ncbi:RHS repeat-associated core domain-containing protein [Pleionea sp. CnH1-48]|uniref:RHS repeat-associated core domain-containing protein n=1 Tax=Pleionea sp. CnH1-48 TaxID=2954494 RepID=UPI002098381B|nr:RHS repeat-associated core domain-containing protein [Pleionea sp. CnH1-48]MCO7223286.1 RHS repeat-associated core domain-containing protein [Pleionea sp. CnH1-48]
MKIQTICSTSLLMALGFVWQLNVQANQFELEYLYGNSGQLKGLNSSWIGSKGSTANFGVDFDFLPNGQVKGVSARHCLGCESQSVKQLSHFDRLGRATSAVWSDGAEASYQLDNFGRLRYMQLSLPGVSQAQYRADSINYDEWGYVQGYRRVDSTVNNYVGFQYGQQGELTQWNVGNEQVIYGYDTQGNMTSRQGKVGDLPESYRRQYDRKNHVEGWQYDAMGRLVKDDQYHYSYNSAGRLALIQDAETDAVVAAYRYDVSGMRVAVMENDKVNFSHRNGDTVLVQTSVAASGELEDAKLFVPLNGVVVQERSVSGDSTNYFQDRMGNPAVRWGGNDGVMVQEYSPYGQQTFAYGPDVHQGPGGYTGTHEDDATGLTYMRARYQSPTAGKFLTPDPARDFDPFKPQTFNLYQYASNNPVNKVDPTGLFQEPNDENDTDQVRPQDLELEEDIQLTKDAVANNSGKACIITMRDACREVLNDNDIGTGVSPTNYDSLMEDMEARCQVDGCHEFTFNGSSRTPLGSVTSLTESIADNLEPGVYTLGIADGTHTMMLTYDGETYSLLDQGTPWSGDFSNGADLDAHLLQTTKDMVNAGRADFKSILKVRKVIFDD